MTARDDNNPERHNSDSRHDWSIDPDDAQALLSVIELRNGWMTVDGLSYQLGMRISEVEELLDYLEDVRDVDVHDLGRMTLVVAPESDPREAYRELSDREERQWRQLVDDPVDLDEQ